MFTCIYLATWPSRVTLFSLYFCCLKTAKQWCHVTNIIHLHSVTVVVWRLHPLFLNYKDQNMNDVRVNKINEKRNMDWPSIFVQPSIILNDTAKYRSRLAQYLQPSVILHDQWCKISVGTRYTRRSMPSEILHDRCSAGIRQSPLWHCGIFTPRLTELWAVQ